MIDLLRRVCTVSVETVKIVDELDTWTEIDSDEASGLERLRVSMVVRGAYVDLRQFIAAVETAPEFLVIEEILLSGGEEAAGLQVLTLGLATYYWDGGAETTATEQPDATSAEP